MQLEEYLSEQIHKCFCKEWVHLSAAKGKVNGYDVSFMLWVKHVVSCAVEIYGVEDQAVVIPPVLSTRECKREAELICQKVS